MNQAWSPPSGGALGCSDSMLTLRWFLSFAAASTSPLICFTGSIIYWKNYCVIFDTDWYLLSTLIQDRFAVEKMKTTSYVVWQEIYSKAGEGFYCCLKKSWTRTDWYGPTQAASLHLVRLHLLKRMRKSASEERIKDVGNKNRWIVGKWKKNIGNTWMQKNPSGGAQLFMHRPPSLANWVQPWNSLLVTQVESEGLPFVLFGLFRRYQHESFHCHFFFVPSPYRVPDSRH